MGKILIGILVGLSFVMYAMHIWDGAKSFAETKAPGSTAQQRIERPSEVTPNVIPWWVFCPDTKI